MNAELDPRKAGLARVFNAAAEDYDRATAEGWELIGARLVERADLRAGESVLDLASGAGTTAIPAARAVGPTRRVVAVDLAADLLAKGESKARAEGLTNIEFRVGDMEATGYPAAAFDVVLCSLGVFFVPDVMALLVEMRRLARSRVAVSVWGPTPPLLATAFHAALRLVKPELDPAPPPPWAAAIATPESLAAALRRAGFDTVDVEMPTLTMEVTDPDRAWDLVLGGGMRGALEELTPAQVDTVRAELVRQFTGVPEMSVEVQFAVAHCGAPE
ncbi:MAG: class I SAM-dependent methyltransferase [Mycobacteriales bacterium]